MFVLPPIPAGWKRCLAQATARDSYRGLEASLQREAADGEMILPPREDIFAALRVTPYKKVRVVVLGQDPYHTPGMAHGLCFSVRPHIRALPPSLKNVFRELSDDQGCRIPNNGCLAPWARQGVLMLNTALTVRAHAPNSHRGFGWEWFTDRIIELVDAKPTRVVFVLWGGQAKKKQRLITRSHHVVIVSAHPSPLSVRKFRGSRCFSRINRALTEANLEPVDWEISDV